MPASLEAKFKNREKTVIESVEKIGVDKTMAKFGVRTRSTFMTWLKIHRDKVFTPNPMAGFNGGQKSKWLNEHREMVLQLAEVWGDDKVIEEFCLTPSTLHWLKHGGINPFLPGRKLNQKDELVREVSELYKRVGDIEKVLSRLEIRVEMASEGSREVRVAQRKMEQSFDTFVDETALKLAKGLFTPLLTRMVIQQQDLSVNLGINRAAVGIPSPDSREK
jgi:hypothetical protein